MESIGEGPLIPIPKPNKPTGPIENLLPILVYDVKKSVHLLP